jgi:hypothetical protein
MLNDAYNFGLDTISTIIFLEKEGSLRAQNHYCCQKFKRWIHPNMIYYMNFSLVCPLVGLKFLYF